MNELLGVGMALLSTVAAALVSGLRLKPYLDAGAVYTPPRFALYPALIAVAVTVPTVVILFWWRRKTSTTLGPATFTDRQFFAVLWCLLYICTALIFFPYQPPTHYEAPKSPLQPVVLQVAFANESNLMGG